MSKLGTNIRFGKGNGQNCNDKIGREENLNNLFLFSKNKPI